MNSTDLLNKIGKTDSEENKIIADLIIQAFESSLKSKGLVFFGENSEPEEELLEGADSVTGTSIFNFSKNLRTDLSPVISIVERFGEGERILSPQEYAFFKKDSKRAYGLELPFGIYINEAVKVRGVFGYGLKSESQTELDSALSIFARLAWSSFKNDISENQTEISSQSVGGVSVSYRATKASKASQNPFDYSVISNLLKKFL